MYIDDFKTIYCKPDSLNDVNLWALYKFLKIPIGEGYDYINVYTQDSKIIERIINILGDRVEQVED